MHPCNPTGAVYSDAELAALGAVLEEHDVAAIVDEIYARISYVPVGRWLRAAPQLADRSLIVDGVSKAYAMTGWRLGWLVGPPDLMQIASALQSHLTSHPSSITQRAAQFALENNPAVEQAVDEMVGIFRQRRDAIVAGLSTIDGIVCEEPEGAFYVFPDVRGLYDRPLGPNGRIVHSAAELSAYLLDEALVVTVPGEAFGTPGFIRLSYALAMDQLQEGVSPPPNRPCASSRRKLNRASTARHPRVRRYKRTKLVAMANIAVIGTNYVGLVTAACFAELGNQVVGIDIDPGKVERLGRGQLPIYEPGLEEIVVQNIKAGRLRFTLDYVEGLKSAQFAFVCVGTPSGVEGEADMSQVKAAAHSLGKHTPSGRSLIVVNKSTMPIGTGDWMLPTLERASNGSGARFRVVSNPEFLREGSAVDDFRHPDRVVLGGTDSSRSIESPASTATCSLSRRSFRPTSARRR